MQPHKPIAERDPDRERAIAEAMALRAPALGADRLHRIVHAIITESLDAAEAASGPGLSDLGLLGRRAGPSSSPAS